MKLRPVVFNTRSIASRDTFSDIHPDVFILSFPPHLSVAIFLTTPRSSFLRDIPSKPISDSIRITTQPDTIFIFVTQSKTGPPIGTS
jgi:hypothetical protein